MNLLALTGIVNYFDKLQDNNELIKITLKVERAFIEEYNKNSFFDEIDVYISSFAFKKELRNLKIGSLVGLKGRVQNVNNILNIFAEKIHIF